MKILSVKLLNINSLKGKHEINFDAPPFTQTGLFAITGPTGSGKTSILDAIALALYGRAHRHGSDKPIDVMTRHTGECWSEVIFDINGKQYQSKWLLRRSRGKATGKIQPTKMELAELTSDIIIEDRASKVPQAVAQLTGLDYNRFMRSVMLSQGDFAAFLKAKEKERGELLERITGTQIYSKISKATYERWKEEKSELDKLSAKLDTSNLLDEESKTIALQTLAEKNKHNVLVNQQLKVLQQQIQWQQNIAQLQHQAKHLAGEKQQLFTQQMTWQADFTRLQLHEKTLPFQNDLTTYRNHATQLMDLQAKIEEIVKEIPALAHRKRFAKNQLDKWEQATHKAKKRQQYIAPITEKVLVLEQTIILKQKALTKEKDRLQKVEQEVIKNEKTKNELKKQVENAKNQLIKLQNWLVQHAIYQELPADISLLQQHFLSLSKARKKWNAQQKVLIQNEENQKQEAENLKNNQKSVQNYQKRIHDLTQKQVEFQQQITRYPSSDELNKKINQWNRRIPKLENQCQIAQTYLDKQQQREELLSLYQKYKNELTEIKQTLTKRKQEEIAAQNQLDLLQQAYELELKIAKYEKARQLLQKNEPCPLCGSEQHPFIDNNYQNTVSATKKRLNNHKKEVTQITKQISQISQEKSKLITLLDTTLASGKAVKAEMNNLSQTFTQINELLQIANNISKTVDIQFFIQKEKNELLEATEQLTNIKTLEKNLNKLQTTLHKHKQTLAEAQKELASAEQNQEYLLTESTRIQTEMALIEQQELQQISNKLYVILAKYQLQAPPTNKQKKFLADLKEKTKAYEENKNKKLTVEKNGTSFQAQLNNIHDQYGKLLEQTQHIQQEYNILAIQLEELGKQKSDLTQNFQTSDAKTEQQYWKKEVYQTEQKLRKQLDEFNQIDKLLAQHEELRDRYQFDRKTLHDQLEDFTQTFIQNLHKQGFSSISQLEDSILSSKLVEEITHKKQQSDKQLTEINKSIKDNEIRLQEETQKELTLDTSIVLQQKIGEQEREQISLQQEIGKIKGRLEQDELLKIKYAKLAQEIDNQKKEYRRWDNLKNLIGSADGNKFSKYAQSLTLSRLVLLANKHLQKLNDRYHIRKSMDDKTELELEIIDTYQADAPRPMKTLSGGESFLVSLALALGLSDLAGRHALIQSLFIDEGFGTLDAATLDMAISTLENLQADGKTIGVISHVEALKERIATQIQVRRLSGGHSQLAVTCF